MIQRTRAAAKKKHLEKLKQTILAVGIATKLTFGKVSFIYISSPYLYYGPPVYFASQWMLFPRPEIVDYYWSKVARATVNGELGDCAKVSTNDGSGRSPVICVYTHDFTDEEDVKRGASLLSGLLPFGVGPADGEMCF